MKVIPEIKEQYLYHIELQRIEQEKLERLANKDPSAQGNLSRMISLIITDRLLAVKLDS